MTFLQMILNFYILHIYYSWKGKLYYEKDNLMKTKNTQKFLNSDFNAIFLS